MAAPVLQSGDTVFSSSGGSTVTTLEVTKCTNLVVGNLIVIVAMNDADNQTSQQMNMDNETGWNTAEWGGDGSSDCHFAIFWKVATSTETGQSSYTVDSVQSDEIQAWCYRITGHDPSSPIDGVSTKATGGSATNHTVAGYTTVADDVLAMAVLAFDGGDGDPHSVNSSTNTWTLEDTNSSGTAGTDVSGCTATKSITGGSAATGNCQFDHSATDSAAWVQFGIAFQSGDVTVEPTGVAGTGAAGSVTLVGEANVSPTGVSATGGVGSVAVGVFITVPVTGLEATGTVGDVILTGEGSVLLTGLAGTGQIGDPTIVGEANVPVTGLAATGGVGGVTVVIAEPVDVPVTGVAATGSVGSVILLAEAVVGVTGLAVTGSVGSPAVIAEANVPVTGLAGTTAVGDETVTGDANTAVTGIAATGSVGDVTINLGGISVDVPVTGLAATGSIGSVTTIGEAVVAATGTETASAVGEVYVLAVISPVQDPSWIEIVPTTTPGWKDGSIP